MATNNNTNTPNVDAVHVSVQQITEQTQGSYVLHTSEDDISHVAQLMTEGSSVLQSLQQNRRSRQTTNTQNKLIVCRSCPRTFAKLYNAKEHYNRAHLYQVLKCPKCERIFSYSSGLCLHLKADH